MIWHSVSLWLQIRLSRASAWHPRVAPIARSAVLRFSSSTSARLRFAGVDTLSDHRIFRSRIERAIGASVCGVHFIACPNRFCRCDPCCASASVVRREVSVIAAALVELDVAGAGCVAVSSCTAAGVRGINKRSATDLQHVLTSVALIRAAEMYALAYVRSDAIALGTIDRCEQTPSGALDPARCDQQSIFLRKMQRALRPFARAMRAASPKRRHGHATHAATSDD